MKSSHCHEKSASLDDLDSCCGNILFSLAHRAAERRRHKSLFPSYLDNILDNYYYIYFAISFVSIVENSSVPINALRQR